MMNLTLQTLSAPHTVLRRLAEMTTPRQIIERSMHCIQCMDVDLGSDPTQMQEQISKIAFHEQIDVYWSPSHIKCADFKLLAMDMDSTLITIECVDEIADMQGLKPQVSAITDAAMRGEIAFADSLVRRVALLKDLPISALQRVYDERVQLSLGAEQLLNAVKNAGLSTLLVSGGFTFFTDRIKEKLDLDFSLSNQLEIVDNKLTGRILGDIMDADGKRQAVERTCTQLGISSAQAIVIGDGANDLSMMEIAGLSVAFRAKPVVHAKADAALHFVGLDGVLNLFDLP